MQNFSLRSTGQVGDQYVLLKLGATTRSKMKLSKTSIQTDFGLSAVRFEGNSRQQKF
jgi:hypothetical protein